MYQTISIDRDRHIRLITFNRPDKKNSMTDEMGNEIEQAVAEINGDRTARVVILTGAGNVFSSGGDLDMINELRTGDAKDNTRFMFDFYRKYFSIRKLQQPSIAMINGHAIGAGFCLALGCDLRTISETARVGLTFVRIGLNAGMGGTYTLPRFIGVGRAAELLFTGELITAAKALDWGLVNRVCPADQLKEKTFELAHAIAHNAPLALCYTKQSLYEGLGSDLEQTFALEARGQAVCYATNDLREGVAAVLAKRKPEFSGD